MTASSPKHRLRRLAMDTRPLANPVFRRTFLGQGAAVVGTMVTEVAVPVAGFGSVPLLLALVAVQSGGFAVSSAVRGAIIPALVPPGLVPAASSLGYTASTVGQVLGPLVARVLIGLPNGFCYAYGADAVLFTAALYATFRLPPLSSVDPIGRPGLRSVLDGLRFLAGRRVLLMSFLADIAAMVLAMPTALFPQAAETRWHGGVGLLYSSIAIGSVLAGLFSGWIGRVPRQGVALTAAVVVWAAAVALAGLAPARWLALVLLAVAGAADLVSAVYRQTILQTAVPDRMRGRLQGVYTVVVAGGPRLGDLRAGIMASALPLTVAWSGTAPACAVLVATGAVLVKPFWRYTPGGR